MAYFGGEWVMSARARHILAPAANTALRSGETAVNIRLLSDAKAINPPNLGQPHIESR